MKSLKRWMDFPRITLVIINSRYGVRGSSIISVIVKHLCLSFSKTLGHDNPVIEGYDEAKFADVLKYNERDMAPALEAFRLARVTTAELFDLMSEDQWKRQGVHSESGPYSVEKWLTIYADHAHNHAAQIQRLKDALKRS